MPHDSGRPLIIDVQQMARSYKIGHNIVEALKKVSLQVYQGESLAIMGASGSGKSTLLHLLGCLDSPTEGKYIFNNKDVSNLSDNALAFIRSSQIGFVFQSFNLIPQYTVFENVSLPFLYRNHAIDPDTLKDSIVKALNRVGLAHRLNHHPTELSGGEIQRVAIARAIAINPLLILADEPTGNLDSENGKAILKIFEELNSQGATIIMVTHDPSVAAHCRKLIRMKDGIIIEERVQ